MRPIGTKRDLEARRRAAVVLWQRGNLSKREVAEKIGCAPASVVRWTQAFEKHGDRGLDSKPQSGGKSRLSTKERERLREILISGARAYGWQNDLWTLARVADVIKREFRVGYHISHVHRLLGQLGFSAQKPTRLARERDDVAITDFRQRRWMQIKKSPPRR